MYSFPTKPYSLSERVGMRQEAEKAKATLSFFPFPFS
jgi:hypothetical protein